MSCCGGKSEKKPEKKLTDLKKNKVYLNLREDSQWRQYIEKGSQNKKVEISPEVQNKIKELEKQVDKLKKQTNKIKKKSEEKQNQIDELEEINDQTEAHCTVLQYLNLKEDAAIEEYRYKI